jgi:hypothetical protein
MMAYDPQYWIGGEAFAEATSGISSLLRELVDKCVKDAVVDYFKGAYSGLSHNDLTFSVWADDPISTDAKYKISLEDLIKEELDTFGDEIAPDHPFHEILKICIASRDKRGAAS